MENLSPETAHLEQNAAPHADPTAEPAVRLTGLMKRFGKTVAVQKTDLTIETGELVTLLGPSGCGKTTILRMIAGLEKPTEGDIYIKGRRVNDTPIHKRNLGMIFQNYALFPHKNIFDNVAFGLKYRGVPREEMAEKVVHALEMVRLPGVESRFPSQLSGGQQQRIALARAIVIEPDVLLMDEPLSALDEKLREEMRMEIDNIQRTLNLTTLFVTHDQREALSMSNKIVVMKSGRKQQEGTPEDVYDYPANYFVADFLGHSNFYDARVLESLKGDLVRVRTDEGLEFFAEHQGVWKEGEQVRLVVRAQKINVTSPDLAEEELESTEINCFPGRIYDRSYMGGETSYFVELEKGVRVHVISMVRRRPHKIGDEVVLHVPARHCGLLRNED
ncbi:ABC transporter ATP-binding protein [Paucidesulfovibrio longus]|uniref:ABC transporter ATP-binding protein n=1 Tax=Paucidesulfovibrio longus TaxID=889 RepID=UPI001B7FB7D1|nr:ABC transporter ATP-binding protein [Paucidesulfovibrio longus]